MQTLYATTVQSLYEVQFIANENSDGFLIKKHKSKNLYNELCNGAGCDRAKVERFSPTDRHQTSTRPATTWRLHFWTKCGKRNENLKLGMQRVPGPVIRYYPIIVQRYLVLFKTLKRGSTSLKIPKRLSNSSCVQSSELLPIKEGKRSFFQNKRHSGAVLTEFIWRIYHINNFFKEKMRSTDIYMIY
uniref:Uncharacterized protein n=1 Tax=Romanomermis culicivorax TaxID=13658 RepID=A0A915JIA1_ROMCU